MKKATFTLLQPRGWMSVLGKSAFLVLFAWCMVGSLNAQTAMDTSNDAGAVQQGVFRACDHAGTIHGVGSYTDDGGADGLYGQDIRTGGLPGGASFGGEHFWTFCPTTAMDQKVRITFSDFDILDAGDVFTVYGGNCAQASAAGATGIQISGASVGAQQLTDAAGAAITAAPGVTGGTGWVEASCDNLSGCITIGWNPDGDSNKGNGWAFDVSERDRNASVACPDNRNSNVASMNSTLMACNDWATIPVTAPAFDGCTVAGLGSVYVLTVLNDGIEIGTYTSMGDDGDATTSTDFAGTDAAGNSNSSVKVGAGRHTITYIVYYDANGVGSTSGRTEKSRATCTYTVRDAEDLTCNDNISVSLGNDCATTVTADMVLEQPDAAGVFNISIAGVGGLDITDLGTYNYTVSDACGNVCGGTITIRDLQGPQCPGSSIENVTCAGAPAATAPNFLDCSGVASTSSDDETFGECGRYSTAELFALVGGATPLICPESLMPGIIAAADGLGGGTVDGVLTADEIAAAFGAGFGGTTTGGTITLSGGSSFNRATTVSRSGAACATAAIPANNTASSITVRRWKATDNLGNTSEGCAQIFISLKPDALADPSVAEVIVQCDADLGTDPSQLIRRVRLNPDGTIMLNAAGNPVRLTAGNIAPSGILPTNQTCGWNTFYNDLVVETCGNTKKIIRTWSWMDWCNPAPGGPTTFTQNIKVMDSLEPELSGDQPASTTYSLDDHQCTTDLNLPGASWTDGCGEVTSFRTELRSVNSNGSVGGVLWRNNSNGGAFANITAGSYFVRYYAIDACGNETSRVNAVVDPATWEETPGNVYTVQITVADQERPQPQCDDLINVSLGSDWGTIAVEDVNEGSRDNCGVASMGISLSADGPFGATVDISCADVHESLKVYLQVADAAGNTNNCWGNVQVEDKIAPVCAAPADVTVGCTEFDFHFSGFLDGASTDNIAGTETQARLNELFGSFTCTDNLACVDLGIEEYMSVTKGECGEYTVVRTSTATDWNSPSNTASQTITVEYTPNWSVTFPGDEEVVCQIGGGADLPTFSADDVTVAPGACDQIGIEVESREFVAQDGACRKIEVTYHVINWCQYVPGQDAVTIARTSGGGATASNADGSYVTYTKIIKLVDNVAPVLTIDDPDLCITGGSGDADGCSGSATWTAWADDCVEEEDITWTSRVYEVSATGRRDLVAEGNSAEITVPIFNNSVYVAEFWATDGCGNAGGAETTPRTAIDCKQPTPYALNGIAISLMPTGMVDVWASDLNQGSNDNCDPTDALEYRIRKTGDGAPTSLAEVRALGTSVTFDCLDLGNRTVELYVIDRAGNYDFVTTYVVVQDNLGACTDIIEGSDSGQVAGKVVNTSGEFVEAVNIAVNGAMADDMTTGEAGVYAFTVPTGGDYTITPEKNVNPLNGVSTFDLVLISKHILGIQPFDAAAQYIAADINKSGTVTAFDMVQLRQLILNITTEFTNNTSWRFVDASYDFGTDVATTLSQNFPEVMNINNLSGDMLNVDFTAIKVGDVNGSAIPNSLMGSEVRSTAGTMTLQAQDRFVEAGEQVSVAFTADMTAVQGYQFTMNFAGLELTEVVEGVAKADNFNTSLRGALATSWNGQATSEALFTAKFTATTSGLLSDLVRVSSDVTSAEAYSTTGEALDVAIEFTASAVDASFNLSQNTPNPFTGETVIGFTLPTAGAATLKVMDIQGKVLTSVTADYAKGYNQISLNAKELGATGVLHYQLESADNVATRKMIIIE